MTVYRLWGININWNANTTYRILTAIGEKEIVVNEDDLIRLYGTSKVKWFNDNLIMLE